MDCNLIAIFMFGLFFIWLSAAFAHRGDVPAFAMAAAFTALCLIAWAGFGALNLISHH